MGELLRTLILAGLISGTQPITVMGLLVVMGGAQPRRNGLAFVAGAFLVESLIVLFASLVLGGVVSPSSAPGRALLGVRLALGVLLVIGGLLLRRPARKPAPEIPKVLERLQGLPPRRAFLAGAVVADYQGPVIASLALASTSVSLAGRLAALIPFTVLGSGIPLAIVVAATRSERTYERLSGGTRWTMRNRRRLAAWALLVLGALLVGDAALGLAAVGAR